MLSCGASGGQGSLQAHRHTNKTALIVSPHIGPLSELQKTELCARVASYANLFISLASCLGCLAGYCTVSNKYSQGVTGQRQAADAAVDDNG